MTRDRTNGADVLIVGAGSAGAVLAGRLTEDPSMKVALLEAGRNYTSDETIDALRTRAMSPSLEIHKLPEYYWLDLTARRNVHQSFEFYWRGKGVGGSSAINGQVAFRPPPEDFQVWEKAGCAGWGWDDVLSSFIKLEDDEMFGDEPYHGRGGPIPVARETEENWSALDVAFRDVVLDRGFAWKPDSNAPDADGCGYYAFNSRNGRRVSTNDGYLEPARSRPNLTIRSHVLVDRVLFDGARAIGVRVIGPTGPADLFADQVLLCAGTVGSASMLLRSGMGPAAHLRDLGIEVRGDLPVGAGVQDHANVSLSFAMNPEVAQGIYRPVVCVQYSTGLAEGGRNDAFIGASGPFGPDVQIGALMAWLNQPFSRGCLRLVSPDPAVDAIVDIDLLNDERDRVRARHILRTVCDLFHHAAFRNVIAAPPRAPDGTEHTGIERMSDGEVERWARTVVRDVAHLTGSCRMGSPDDPETVVDADCNVLGFDRLRVIDASIFPFITRANTGVPTMMVAERMADLLRSGGSVSTPKA